MDIRATVEGIVEEVTYLRGQRDELLAALKYLDNQYRQLLAQQPHFPDLDRCLSRDHHLTQPS